MCDADIDVLFIDIDECALGTDTCDEENADCMDIDGSFSCLCHTGYSGDGFSCTSKFI